MGGQERVFVASKSHHNHGFPLSNLTDYLSSLDVFSFLRNLANPRLQDRGLKILISSQDLSPEPRYSISQLLIPT